MATRDLVALNEDVPRLEVPQSGDTANVPTPLDVQGELKAVSGIRFGDNSLQTTAAITDFDTMAPTVTKGDLIVHDGTSNIRLAVGADNEVPIADSTQTSGIRWGVPVAPLDMETVVLTANHTVTLSDKGKLLLVDASAGPITIYLLPAATAGNGFTIAIKKIDSSSNAVTIDANASETIEGATTFQLAKNYDSVSLVCNGSNWLFPSVLGELVKFTQITSSGSIPLDVRTRNTIALLVGGGGGGGGGTTSGTTLDGEGGYGGMMVVSHASWSGGETLTATIGAGGSGRGGRSDTDGGDGGTTSLTGHQSAQGGKGGKKGSGARIPDPDDGIRSAYGVLGRPSYGPGGARNTSASANSGGGGGGSNANWNYSSGSGGSGIILLWEFT